MRDNILAGSCLENAAIKNRYMGVCRLFILCALVILSVTALSENAYAGTKLKLEDDEAYSGAGISWDGKTLVLNNCTFNGQIKLPKDSTVTVYGVNNLVMNQIYDESGVLIGSGALTINGGGTLNITNAVVTHDNCYCIVGKKELTISNVTINASACAEGDIDISSGIMARKAMKITGSNINAAGASSARTSCGIRGSKSIYIQSSNIKATGESFGIVAAGDAMGISASNVEAHGGKAALKAKTDMEFAGVTGGTPGEKNDRYYVMNGNTRATDVKLTVGQ